MTIICIITGILAGVTAAYSYPRLPAVWLCDYGETVQDKHAVAERRLGGVYYIAFALICAASALAALRMSLLMGIFTPIVCGALLLLAKADAQYGILPNELMIIAALSAIPVAFRAGIVQPLLGALIAGGVCAAILFAASKLAHKDAVGMGDVWLCAVGGFVCGYGALMPMLIVTLFSAAISYTVQMAVHKLTIKSTAPLGPYLVLGIICAVCLGREWDMLVLWYLNVLF